MNRQFYYATDEMPNNADDLLVNGNQAIENNDEEFRWEINRTPSDPVLNEDIQQVTIILSIEELQILQTLLQENEVAYKRQDIKIGSLLDTEKDKKKEAFECSICYENIDTNNSNNYCKLNCEHCFCNNCIKTQLGTQLIGRPVCALCREEITNIYTNDSEFVIQ
jgi:hypothetical protein